MLYCHTKKNRINKKKEVLYVEKSSFASHTKHTAKVTNTDLLHS